MKTKLEFIFRREEPFDNYHEPHDNDEDISSMGSKKVFNGFIHEMKISDDKIDFIGNGSKRIGYDIIEHIDGYCYVREINIKPGTYHEIWREPNERELDNFTKILEDAYNELSNGNELIREDILYLWCISKKRDSKINSLLK